MKLLFLSALYPPHTKGGGELSTHYIAQGLIQRDHDVTVITSGEKHEQVELDGVKVIRIPQSFTAKPLFEQRHAQRLAQALQTIIDEQGPVDVIHAHDFRMAQILSELPYTNTIVTARDYAQICGSTNAMLANGNLCTCSWSDVWYNHRVVEASFPRNMFRVWQYMFNIDYRKTSFRKFKHQIFISHAQQELIAKLQDLSQTKTHVIYNPISQTYVDIPVTEAKTRDLLYVGTVESYKGVGLLIKAFHNLAPQFPEVQLKIVGEGADRAKYEQLVASYGLQYRVNFTGRVAWDKLLPLYDAAAIVVAPHRWVEPFGRTVIEGMARGRIVVTADHGGPAELIQPNKTGYLFKKGSVDALTATLTQALQLRPWDIKEISRNAHTWVEHNLTADIIAQQHESVYREITKA